MGEESRMKREKLGGSESLRIRRPRKSNIAHSMKTQYCPVAYAPYCLSLILRILKSVLEH
jgi:hypothetical protein